jgi:hypothetical protein
MIWMHIDDAKPFEGQFSAVKILDIVIVCEYEDGMFIDCGSDDIFTEDEIDFWLGIPEPPEVEYEDDETDEYGLTESEQGLHVNNARLFAEEIEPEPIAVFFIKDAKICPDRMLIFSFNMN